MSGDNPKDILNEIDVRLNGVLGELGRALGDALTKLDQGGGEVTRSQSFQTSKGPVRAEAGIRVRMGGMDLGASDRTASDPQPVNTPEPNATADPVDAQPPSREIAATIVASETQWSLTAELPGAAESELKVTVSGDQLEISTTGVGRSYAGTFDVPSAVTQDTLSVSLRNGILDIVADLDAAGST